jgi:hypothetical protein
MTTITIPVAEEIKRAFESAKPETQQQLSSIVTLFFRYNLADKSGSTKFIMLMYNWLQNIPSFDYEITFS